MLLQLVNRCLEKDPDRRFQSASDLAFHLEALRTPTGGQAVDRGQDHGRVRSRLGRYVVVGAALGLVLGPAALPFDSRRRGRALLPQVERLSHRWGTIGGAGFLPDGRVAFSAAFEGSPEELFIRPAGTPVAQPVGIKARLAAVSRSGELAVLLN